VTNPNTILSFIIEKCFISLMISDQEIQNIGVKILDKISETATFHFDED